MNKLIRLSLALLPALSALIPMAARADDMKDISLRYDDRMSGIIVSSHEKVFNADTSVGVSYGFPGYFLREKPKEVSIAIFGYHDGVQWDKIKSLTVEYGGKSTTGNALTSTAGPDRDKSSDLLKGNYFETVVVAFPVDTITQILNSDSVHVTSTPAGLDVTMSNADLAWGRELLDSIPKLAAVTPAIDTIAQSSTGLPLDKHVDPSTGDVCRLTKYIKLTPKFLLQFEAFPIVDRKPVAHPQGGLLLTEFDEDGDPELAKVESITISTGTKTLKLTSDLHDTQNVDLVGVAADRRFSAKPSEFAVLLAANQLKITVGSTVLKLTSTQLAGLHAIVAH